MKTRYAVIAAISALVLLEGCVSTPDGPTVPVMPAHGKSLAQFNQEDIECRNFADSRVAGGAQEANNRAITSALIGTALGAGLGAAVGDSEGAAIGAGSGAVAGTAVGANQSGYAQAGLQGRYNIAYAQCMKTKGNELPGYRPDYDEGGYPPPPPPPPGY